MDITPVINKILKDIRVELTDEFDRNFERKAFFGEKWPERRFPNTKGTVLLVTGQLRRSILSKVDNNSVTFSSNLPYAALHNYGGKIKVTAKMKKFFWAKAKETKSDYWRNMALKRVNSTITMPKRQFLGEHPKINKICKEIIADDLKRWLDSQKLISPTHFGTATHQEQNGTASAT